MEEDKYEKLINVIVELYKKKNKLLEELPYHLNVISSAARGKNLKEIAHTMILTDLLKCPKIQSSFLNFFFSLDIDINDPLVVKREERGPLGQPDIILYNKEICIIIENKVNSGPEQDCQCGRYYLTARDKLKKVDGKKIYKNIYFLYLNSDDTELPSKKSLKIPDSENKLVTEVLGEHFIVRSFAYDMREWLKQLYNELIGSKDEEYLISGIHQYADYLDYKYEIGERFNNMRKELEQYLANGTEKIEKFDTILKLSDLKKKAELVAETVKHIIFVKNKEEIEKIKNNYTNEFEESSKKNNEYGIKKETADNIVFCIETNLGDDNIFYGIKCIDDKNDDIKNDGIKELIKNLVSDNSSVYKEDAKWPIYKYASSSTYDKIYIEFKNFVEFVTSTDNSISHNDKIIE